MSHSYSRPVGGVSAFQRVLAGQLALDPTIDVVATLGLSLVSFPMVGDGEGPLVALITSVRAARKNPGVTVAWGLRVAGLLVLGAAPAFLGLAIVLPVLGYATWHLYTRLVVR